MSDGLVKSAARVLDVLEHFADTRAPASVGQIAGALAIPQSSASVLLHSLERLGYLHYDKRERRFAPTHRVALLGSWIEYDGTHGVISKVLDTLHARTRETVILAIENGIHAQYIQVRESLSEIRLHLKAGTRRPLVLCATGWAFLAQKTNAEIALILRRSHAEEPKTRSMKADELSRLIEGVRACGVATSRGHVTAGAGVVAMLLPEQHQRARLALGIGAPIDRIERDRGAIVAALQSVTRSSVAIRRNGAATKK